MKAILTFCVLSTALLWGQNATTPQDPTTGQTTTGRSTPRQTTTTATTTGTAQSAGLSGRILDAGGQPLSNTTVIITDSSGTAQRVVSGADGSFAVPAIAPGSYRIEVESNGTRRAGRQDVTIVSGTPSQIEVTFDEAATSSTGQMGTVEVRGSSPTLQTDSAEVSRAYGTRTIRSLPVLDRQHQELIGLMPGITPPVTMFDRIDDPQRTRQFNVNGQPAFANVHYQDGSYNNEQATGRMSRVAPNEAVQQLNIRTSNYNAEYGFAGGSWGNTVTRPGTNRPHGSIFGFHTGSFFTARNPLNVANNPDPNFNQNQFGGSAGLPLIKDRMFAFISYEGFMQRGNQLSFATVPTAALRAGNFSAFAGQLYNPMTGTASGTGRGAFTGNMIPNALISPFANALLGYLPLPNQEGLTNNLVGNTRLLDDTHRFDGKIDHRFSDKTTGFFRYGFTHASIDRGSLLGALGNAATAGLRNHNAVANVSHNFSNTLVSEFRMSYSRYRNQIGPWDQFGDFGALSNTLGGFGFANGLPQVNIGGFSSFGLPGNYPSKAVNNTYNPAINLIWHSGIHQLKAGFQYRWIDASGFDAGLFSPRGSFLFGPGATASAGVGSGVNFNSAINSFASFLLGAPAQAGISSFAGTPGYRQTHYAGYLTDTLNLWSKLYLELGVRYEAYSPLEPRNAGGAVLFDPGTNTISYAGQNGVDIRGGRNWDTNNIAPRVGIAFRPFNRLVVRGGYGIHYFPLPFLLNSFNPAATGTQVGYTGGFGSVPFTLPVVPTMQGTTAANLPYYVGAERTDRTPYVQTYSLMIQGDLGNGFLLDVGYVGTAGRKMPYSRIISAAAPGTGVLGLPFASFNRTAAVWERGTGMNNNYNSAQVNLTKRFAAGLAFAGSYTFSKALDYGYEFMNPFDVRSNYGRADWDRTHILAISHVWNLPFGPGSKYFTSGAAAHVLGNWELNGIMRWATGTPYTVTADPLFCACPGLAGVPAAYSGSMNLRGAASFEPGLFSAPGSGQFGSLSRNSISGPDLFTYNLSLFRNFAVAENVKFELRGEVYNLTNSTNYANPVASLNSPGFGRSISTFNGFGGRQFQVGGRFLF
ncbi:MAG: TonB-dependent receptor [Bryobacterales bacterium]|nr:TonB-dependent receptor [Bryobacterales bacterium]